MKTITPKIDAKNLVRELGENKVQSLELIREALSNAKDHGASRIYIRTSKSARNEVSVLLIDDGQGMGEEGLAAVWGIGTSVKPERSTRSIGYKGHGTKLYFLCRKLTVATCEDPERGWLVTERSQPDEAPQAELQPQPLPPSSEIHKLLEKLQLVKRTGTFIAIEELRFGDASMLLSRGQIESYCDWFTILGDIRAGLFPKRSDFHRAVHAAGVELEGLRLHECDLRPMDLWLQVNGEKDFYRYGQGPTERDRAFLGLWRDDLESHRDKPGLSALGHRFADHHESQGATQIKNDLTALCLTTPENWVDDDFGIVLRVEGQRRQRETYLEARWQRHSGVYGFEERFGLWLCRDFLPIRQRNDILRRAIESATKGKVRLELRGLRPWQVFVNWQGFVPTANRNDISNQQEREAQIEKKLTEIIGQALKQKSFRDWIFRLSRAQQERRRDSEIADMDLRRQQVSDWISDRKKRDAIDPAHVEGLEPLDLEESIQMRAPQSEQELFYVYSLLSARYRMPIHVLEYDASQGVDAIGLLRSPSLVSPRTAHARVEFKYELSEGNPIDHYFDAIDAIICWRVVRPGDLYEEGSMSETVGKLRRRKKSVLTPPFDTFEIVYPVDDQAERVIPVLEVSALWKPDSPRRS